MKRRDVLTGTAGLLAGWPGGAFGQQDALAALLGEVAADPSLVEASWEFQEQTVSRGVGHGAPSRRRLPQLAIDLIVTFEVASKSAYEARYRNPIWPKGESGVTIGIGYDLRFANTTFINRDWPMLSPADRALLAKVAGLGGAEAQQALPQVRAVDIGWDPAMQQFLAFLPFPTKDTESAFPNCDRLNDTSFGALVSLVYNRGAALGRNSDKRREMYEIHELMVAQQFAAIPDRIRSMKRLWENDPKSRGLLKRRDAEALLFERGLKPA